MRYFEIEEKFNKIQSNLRDLDEEYKNLKKGDLYQRRKMNLLKQLDGLKTKAKNIGCEGNICQIKGKRSRPHAKNPNLMVTERFNLYFTNITEQEASQLVKLHVKNVIQYTITFIRPGLILTTS